METERSISIEDRIHCFAWLELRATDSTFGLIPIDHDTPFSCSYARPSHPTGFLLRFLPDAFTPLSTSVEHLPTLAREDSSHYSWKT